MSAQPGNPFSITNRRHFLKTGLVAGAGALFAARFARAAEPGATPVLPPTAQPPAAPSAAPSKVALTNGDDRTDNIFRALRSVEQEIVQSIGNRRVVIKPNNVSPTNQLATRTCLRATNRPRICAGPTALLDRGPAIYISGLGPALFVTPLRGAQLCRREQSLRIGRGLSFRHDDQ